MRIAIHTTSAAVARTLEGIILASGHTIAKQDHEADLTLIDSFHSVGATSPTTPAIILTEHANSNEALVCPIRPQALLQHVLMHEHTNPLCLHNSWSLDLLARTLVHPNGAVLTLTEKECSLLKIITQQQPASVKREALLEQVWGIASNVDTHTLETHVYRLRGKLGELNPSPGDILTELGAYRLIIKD